MKSYILYPVSALLTILLIACYDTGELNVQNSIHGAVIKDVRWGDIFLSEKLLPGETSGTALIYDQNDPNYGIDLPASYPIKFYMDVGGDLIYLQTREEYKLDVDEKIEVVLTDTTEVFNPLLEAN